MKTHRRALFFCKYHKVSIDKGFLGNNEQKNYSDAISPVEKAMKMKD